MAADNFLQKQQKQRGRPFEKGRSGNPAGRPRGNRNRSTLAAQLLLQGEAEALTRKAVELAPSGDPTALRLCLDRLIAPHRERLVPLEQDSNRLNQKEDSHIWRFVIQDAGWGWGPA